LELKRLKKSEVAELISRIIAPAKTDSGNWLEVDTAPAKTKVYFSQTKPSAASKGHWTYEFFHTLGFDTVEEVCRESGCMILLNYVDRTYAILDGADLLWLAMVSSRQKSNDGPVIDIVINRSEDGGYRLTSYDRVRKDSRPVEVKSWIQ